MTGIWSSWKILFCDCEIFRKLPSYDFDCIVVVVHLLKSQYCYRRSMLRLAGCKISVLEIYLFSKMGNCLAFKFFFNFSFKVAFFSFFQYAALDIYLWEWIDKGTTKRDTENSEQLVVLFCFEHWKEWKHTSVCNKKYKFREGKILNYKHFQTNAHLTARRTWSCLGICQLLAQLKLVQILTRAIWLYRNLFS